MSADDTLVSENEQSKGMGEELNRVEGWAFFACYILLFGGVSKFRPTSAHSRRGRIPEKESVVLQSVSQSATALLVERSEPGVGCYAALALLQSKRSRARNQSGDITPILNSWFCN